MKQWQKDILKKEKAHEKKCKCFFCLIVIEKANKND